MAKPKSSGIGGITKSSGFLKLLENFNAKRETIYKDEDGNLKPSEWNITRNYPKEMPAEEAIRKIENGYTVLDEDGISVKFTTKMFEHWNEKGKSKENIEGRLKHLPMAIDTVQHPMEVWDQGKQIAYVQAYIKQTGGKKGFVVFVEKGASDRVVITSFPLRINELNKVRKGIKIK